MNLAPRHHMPPENGSSDKQGACMARLRQHSLSGFQSSYETPHTLTNNYATGKDMETRTVVVGVTVHPALNTRNLINASRKRQKPTRWCSVTRCHVVGHLASGYTLKVTKMDGRLWLTQGGQVSTTWLKVLELSSGFSAVHSWELVCCDSSEIQIFCKETIFKTSFDLRLKWNLNIRRPPHLRAKLTGLPHFYT